jgi:hypothetical protein
MVAPVVLVLGEFSIILAGCSGGRASLRFLELGRESFSWSGFAVFTALHPKFGLLTPNMRERTFSHPPPLPLSPSPPRFLTRIFYCPEIASDG